MSGSGLAPGEWFYLRMENDTLIIPRTVNIMAGSWEHRRIIRKVTKMQALALWRWHTEYGGEWISVKDGNGKWYDIRVAGDIDAFHGDE